MKVERSATLRAEIRQQLNNLRFRTKTKKNTTTGSAAEQTTTPTATDSSPTSTDMVWTLTKITKVLTWAEQISIKPFLIKLSSRFERSAHYLSFGLVFRLTIRNPYYRLWLYRKLIEWIMEFRDAIYIFQSICFFLYCLPQCNHGWISFLWAPEYVDIIKHFFNNNSTVCSILSSYNMLFSWINSIEIF